jgi:NTP pyrophosphatase (non-canonical NTP hydrolase)
MKTMREIQLENAIWVAKNFGEKKNPERALLGVVEEVGELAHSQLKMMQGIRGTKEEHIANAKDAVGDIVIYLMDYCNGMGFDFHTCVEETWLHVSRRDWTKNKEHGNDPRLTQLNPTPEPSPFDGVQPDRIGAADIKTPYYAESDDWRRRKQAESQEGIR